MKNQQLPFLFLFVIAFFLSPTFTHGQTLVDQNNMWAYYTDTGLVNENPTGNTTVYSFGEPEVVDTYTYHRLRMAGQFEEYAYWEDTDLLMREDSLGRVYLKNGEEAEILIYDFSLEMGDVFQEPIDGCTLTLSDKDSITTNSGALRERFIFDNGTVWVKGIGSLISMIPDCTPGEGGLVCYQADVELLYTGPLYFETDGDCIFLPVHTTEISTNTLRLFPNPARHTLRIQAEGRSLAGELTIYNAMGQRVHQEQVPTVQQHEVDISQHPAGIYYLEIGGLQRKFTKVQ